MAAERGLVPQSSYPVVVTKLIRKVHGGSQSAIVQCEDDRYYVLKLNGSPQGPNVLANEFLGCRLGRAVGLPVAAMRILVVTQDFLERHPTLHFKGEKFTYLPQPGSHFGSVLMGENAGSDRALEWLRPSDVNRISNRSDFLGMYLFDVWAMHADARQSVFVTDRNTKALRGTFIDNGHLCGGPRWEDTQRRFIARHREQAVYMGLWSTKAVRTWSKTFQRVLPQELTSASALIPKDWYSGDLTAICNRLTERLADLPRLFETHSLIGNVPSCGHNSQSVPLREQLVAGSRL